jgi:ABC-type nitrate/sulfonate/bicarbonate transport system permease component
VTTRPAILTRRRDRAAVRRPRGPGWRGLLAIALPPFIFSVVFLGAWQAYCVVFDISEAALPTPVQVAEALWSERELLLDNTWITVQEILLGFLCAVILGVGLGTLLSSFRWAERAIYPWLVVSQLVPIPAIAPVFVIWFGFDMRPKILVVTLVAFFPIVVNTIDGLKAVEPELINLMRTLRASRRRIFLSAKLPAALPFIFSGMKVAAAFSVIGAVFGEWVGSSEGLGYLILTLNNQTATDEVFAVVVVLALIGIGLFAVISLIERLVLPWYHQPRAAAGLG